MKIKLIPSTFCIERSCFCYFSYCKQISSNKQQLINIALACLNLYLSHRGFLGLTTPTLPQPSGIPLEIQVNVCFLRPLSPLKFPTVLLSWVWLFFDTMHLQSSNNSGRQGRGPEGLQKLPPPPPPSLLFWVKNKKKITEGSKADRANNTTPLFPQLEVWIFHCINPCLHE